MVALATYGDENGRPVLFLHGNPASRLGLDPIVDEPARRRGVRLLVPDRPGIGGTDPPLLSSVADYAKEIAAISDVLGLQRFAVVGLSGGGPFALACGALLSDRVTAVATMGGVARPDTAAVRSSLMSSDARMLARFEHGDEVAVAREMRLIGLAIRWLPWLMLAIMKRANDASDRRIMGRWVITMASAAFAQGTAGAVNENRIWFAPWGFELTDIGVPVHVWHGERDRNVSPVHAQTLVAAIPNATLHPVPGVGHFALGTHFGDVLDSVIPRQADHEPY